MRQLIDGSCTWNCINNAFTDYSAYPYFYDVPSTLSSFKYVQKLKELGAVSPSIPTAGCSYGNYCPDSPIPRGQMSIYIINGALGLTGDGNPQLTSPAPGSSLTSSPVTFAWGAVLGAQDYWLDVGTVPSSGNIFGGYTGGALQKAVDISQYLGQVIYVQLYTKFRFQTPVPGTGSHFQFASVSNGDFTLSSPPLQNVPAGQSINGVPESITRTNGFNSLVNLSWTNASSWPAGLSASFTQNPAATSTSISISTAPSTPAGTYILNFSGTASGKYHTASVSVRVAGFNWQPLTDVRLVALDTGEVYGYFSAWVQSSDYCCWTNQIQNARISGPNGNFWGTTSGPVTNDSSPSIVSFPAFILSQAGFGNYVFSFTTAFRWNGSAPFAAGQTLLFNYPTPSLSSMSRSYGVPGTTVSDITISGAGLGVPDLAVNQFRGLSSVNLSGNGLSATFAPAFVPDPPIPTGTSLSADVTIGSNVMPGAYLLSVTAFGYTTNSLPFTVGDLSPVISAIQQPTPLYAGGQDYIAIYGSNFGPGCGNLACPAAAISVCNNNASVCTSSDVHPVVSYWSNNQINVQLSADFSASGFYDVQITSAGATGNGFNPVPQGTTSSKSNRKTVAVTGQSNLTLRVTSNGNAVNSSQCLLIDTTPQMPQLTATVVSQDGSLITGNATWQVNITFAQKMRPDGHEEVQTTSYPSGPLQSVPANQPWNVPFGSLLAGGEAAIQWTYNGGAQTSFPFCIRGQNPDFGTATAALDAVPYWFAKNIAIHETNMSQFCEAGRAQVAYCANSSNYTLPIWGTPGGYGMMQVDPPPSQNAIWNWRAAIAAGQDRIQTLAGPAQDGEGGQAYQFWLRQARQFEQYNATQPANAQVQAPVDPGPYISPACTFVYSKTAYTGQANAHWFGDAILIKQYGGTGDIGGNTANYLSWVNNNPNVAVPVWQFHKSNKISKDVAYEVCTCTTPGSSSCQHLGP